MANSKTAKDAKPAENTPETTASQPPAEAASAPDQAATVATPSEDASIFDQAAAFCLPDGFDPAQARPLWDALQCDHLPAPLAVAAFDCAIQNGGIVASRILAKLGIMTDPDKVADSTAKALERSGAYTLMLDFFAHALRRQALSANAVSKMHPYARHILELHYFIAHDLHT